jgi:hypothetical protein
MAIFGQLPSDKRQSAFEVARPEHFHSISSRFAGHSGTAGQRRATIVATTALCNGRRVCVSRSRTWNHHLVRRFESLRYFAVAVPAADPACPGRGVSIVDLGVALVTSASRLVS